MEVCFDSKTGPHVPPLSEINRDLQGLLDQQQPIWVEQLKNNPGEFRIIKTQIHKTFLDLADQVVAGVLATACHESAALEKLTKKTIDDAPNPLRRPEKCTRMVQLLGGLCLWIVTIYCPPSKKRPKEQKCKGSGIYPELAVLGIDKGCSPALNSLVARTTALLPSFEIAREELIRRGLDLDIKKIHRIGQHLGKQILTTRTCDLEDFRADSLPVGPELNGKRVGVAIDGGRVRIRTVVSKAKRRGKRKNYRRKFRTEWREPKLVIIFLMDEKGRRLAGSQCWIDGTFQGPDELMELVAMHLHRLGAVHAEKVAFVSDGAPWIWDRLEWVEKRVGLNDTQVYRVLDWYHAVQYLGKALGNLDLPEASRRQIYQRLKREMWAGRMVVVVKELRERAGPAGSGNKDAWTAIHYFEKHHSKGHMEYGRFRKAGIPIGSGSIESAVRRVVNLRMKGNGILWRIENAEGMLVVRAAALTGRWEETLDHVRERLASNSCLDWLFESPDMTAELKAGLPQGPSKPQVLTGKESGHKAA